MKKTYIAPTEVVVRIEMAQSLLVPASAKIAPYKSTKEDVEENPFCCGGDSCWNM